ncbi:hypothetical protein Tco_0690184 [Tanacetum coccineum]
MTQAATRKLVADSVAAALEAQAATMGMISRLTLEDSRNWQCPTMVPNSEKLMEVFIEGLLRNIKGNVTASKPQTLEEAITITHRLIDQREWELQKSVGHYKNQCPQKSILAEGQERSPRPERSHGKVVRIPIDVETLIIRAQVMEKKSDEKRLEDILIVRPRTARTRGQPLEATCSQCQ